MDFFTLWPRHSILLVWGAAALRAVRAQCKNKSAVAPKPQCGDKYGIVCTSPFTGQLHTFQLYGGEPLLVINAQMYTYEEMTSLAGSHRTIYVSKHVPYWHHTFKVQENPFGFDIPSDPVENNFCCMCLRMQTCKMYVHDKHYVCDVCTAQSNPEFCLHASHKREKMQDDLLEHLDYFPCNAEECIRNVDASVRCNTCFETGYCSVECLQNSNHVCFTTTSQ